MSTKSWTMGMIIPLMAVAGVATAPAASASGGGGGVRASGACSVASHWTMKAKPDNGRIELELEVDSNRIGQTWAVHIADNGVGVFTGNRVTRAPSGSFEVRKLTANRAGVDHFVGTAKNTRTGETCTAKVNL
jgi:hypothetical protein